jgi:hypothetical protein
MFQVAIFIGVSLLWGYFYPMQKRLPPFLENGPVDVVERSQNGGVLVSLIPVLVTGIQPTRVCAAGRVLSAQRLGLAGSL